MISDAILDESMDLLVALPFAKTDTEQFKGIMRALIRRDCPDAIDADLGEATLDLLASEKSFPAPATFLDAIKRRAERRVRASAPQSTLRIVEHVCARTRAGVLCWVSEDDLDSEGFAPDVVVDKQPAPNVKGHASEFLADLGIRRAGNQ